eukprot:522174-Rhodomonas_salina.5
MPMFPKYGSCTARCCLSTLWPSSIRVACANRTIRRQYRVPYPTDSTCRSGERARDKDSGMDNERDRGWGTGKGALKKGALERGHWKGGIGKGALDQVKGLPHGPRKHRARSHSERYHLRQHAPRSA